MDTLDKKIIIIAIEKGENGVRIPDICEATGENWNKVYYRVKTLAAMSDRPIRLVTGRNVVTVYAEPGAQKWT